MEWTFSWNWVSIVALAVPRSVCLLVCVADIPEPFLPFWLKLLSAADERRCPQQRGRPGLVRVGIRDPGFSCGGSQQHRGDHIYAELGKLWAQTRRGLEALPPAQAHVPGEGRTADEDLED